MTINHQPTPEQQSIIESIGSKRSTMVEAGAGCAKTTTLELASRKVKVPALALAFNKRIAEEMGPRLGPQFTVKTLNGLGHGAWGRSLPAGTQIKLDDRKLGKIITTASKFRKMNLDSVQWDGLRRLVSGAMMAGIVPREENFPGLVPDTREGWLNVALDQGMLVADFEYLWELAQTALRESIKQARAGVISFDDQIYCSVMLGGRFPQFPVVFVDESQDLSPLNHMMLGKVLRPDGQLVSVGDSRQAIYAFRGASSASMAAIRELREHWNELPLMTTFRCPKVVVERQQQHVPLFRAADSAPKGVFARFRAPFEALVQWKGWTWAEFTAVAEGRGAPTFAILCRNNGPLLTMAFKLLRQQIPVRMQGRDIGKGLVALSKKLLPEDQLPADACRGLIKEWESSECSKLQVNGMPERCAGITDRAECLYAVLDGAGARDAGELRAALERLFSADSGVVTLSSIHRAKGLEWDCVLHLDPWRVPSKQARAIGGAVLEQEWNLKYVAETRTKWALVQANLENFH